MIRANAEQAHHNKGLLQKRIGLSLFAQGSSRSVTTQEVHIISKRQKLVLDGSNQLIMVTARQVSPSDRTFEKNISHMRKLVRG